VSKDSNDNIPYCDSKNFYLDFVSRNKPCKFQNSEEVKQFFNVNANITNSREYENVIRIAKVEMKIEITPGQIELDESLAKVRDVTEKFSLPPFAHMLKLNSKEICVVNNFFYNIEF